MSVHPRCSAELEPVFAKLRTQPHVVSVTTPYEPAGARFVSSDGKIALRRDPVRRAGQRRADRPREAHARHREAMRTRTSVQVELGGSMFTDQTQPASEADRRPRRRAHPADRVRFAARDGPADHDRAVRHRHRPRDRQPARAGARRAVVRAAGDGDDRHRRRHRLRPVHQHPLSRGAARGRRSRRRRRARARHQRPRRAVRGRHRGDLAARAVRDRRVVHPRPGDRRVARGAVRHGAPRSRCCPRCSASSGTPSTSSRCRAPRRTRPVESSFWARWSRTLQAPAVARRDRRPRRSSLVLAVPVFSLRLGVADCGQRSDEVHDPAGLRPAGAGIRARLQRAAPRRGRSALAGRPRPPLAKLAERDRERPRRRAR